VNAFHVNNSARVLASHRWLESSGEDVVIVGTLSETSLYNYQLGVPKRGTWREVFNSDFFESSAGHSTAGNSGQVFADGPPLHGFETSARITIPANGAVIFAR
jgi:1,4-alpha-glucan branching enzyme